MKYKKNVFLTVNITGEYLLYLGGVLLYMLNQQKNVTENF